MHRRPTRMLPWLDSILLRGCTRVSACRVIECVPDSKALSEITKEDEKLTGGFGPLLSMVGRIECRLLDMLAWKRRRPVAGLNVLYETQVAGRPVYKYQESVRIYKNSKVPSKTRLSEATHHCRVCTYSTVQASSLMKLDE